ncbi:MAG TPA: enoyl-CoA hydratase/isomerase family protein [Gemmatimonadales bacterium]
MTSPNQDGRVTTQVADGVASVSFHHPKGNSLPGAILARLAEEIAALGANPAATVIVLRSEGDGPFCAGASFQELQAVRTPEEGQRFFMGFARLILAMTRCPKFILARVHGKVVGGGVGVCAASDYAIAVPEAAVKLSELAVGIGPFVVGPVIEKKIGLAAFSMLSVNAQEWRVAEWAREHGLFAEVRDTVEELDQAIADLASRLAASNPEAMARMKQIFWQGTDHWETLLAERAAMSGSLVVSDFTRRAIGGR